MNIQSEIRKGSYFDSVVLMQLQRALLQLPAAASDERQALKTMGCSRGHGARAAMATAGRRAACAIYCTRLSAASVT